MLPSTPVIRRTRSARLSLTGIRSVTTTVPRRDVYVVSSTPVSPTYRRLAVCLPAGPISHRPLSGSPRRAAKHAWESKRGRHSQSIEPSLPTSAAVLPSPRAA